MARSFEDLINKYKKDTVPSKHKNQILITELVKPDGSTVKTNKEITNTFNTYFLNEGRDKMLECYGSLDEGWHPKFIIDKEVPLITEKEFDIFFNNFAKIYVLSDVSNISMRALNSAEAKKVIRNLLNEVLKSNTFPDILKNSVAYPKLKHVDQDKKLLESYIPLQKFSIFSSFLEFVLEKRIRRDFTADPFQYYFSMNKSKETKFIHILADYVMFVNDERFNKKKHVASVFIDIKNPSTTLSHAMLLKKLLEKVEFPRYLQNIISSYLSNRKLKTSMDGTTFSDEGIRTHGLDIMSILTNILICLYFDDLKEKRFSGKCFLYEYKPVLVCSANNLKELESSIKQNLLLFYDWVRDNKLIINIHKTDYMLFKSEEDTQVNNFKITLLQNEIQRVSSKHFLGVIVDENLNFEEHTKSLVELKPKPFKYHKFFFSNKPSFNKFKQQCLLHYFIRNGSLKLNMDINKYNIDKLNDPIMISKASFGKITEEDKKKDYNEFFKCLEQYY